MQHYLKIAIMTVSILTIFISSNSAARSNDLTPIKSKIVGGVPAAQEQWPWMSALVNTSSEISTTLTVNNTIYSSQPFTGGFVGTATGETIDCGIGQIECTKATNKICVIARGDIDFSLKVENCQAGGGIGAIIYNNVEGTINGTLGDNFAGSIPAVSITQANGTILQNNIGAIASLAVSEEAVLSITCGASFLGDKWLLTASHCVEDTSAEQLKVSVGEYSLSDGVNNVKTVKRIYMHADYQLGTELNNDIALIELVESVNNPAISLLDLAATEQFSSQNSSVTVAGWGGRKGYAPDEGPTSNFPNILHQVDLQLLTNDECKNLFAQSNTDIDITNAMICAYIPGGGQGSCQGDSGGPLMINTNEGWQQIGIVSWGIGCAADGFPGVYTRTGLFNDWVNGITQGISIDQVFDFPIQIKNKADSAHLTVINNSNLTANLTFSIDGNSNFTIANDSCNIMDAGTTCSLQINYQSAETGIHTANVIISSDNSDIPTSTSKISAQTIALARNLKEQLSSADNALDWYSGGNLPWLLDNTEAAIVSGSITDNQESIVMVTVAGEGELTFEWAVSSEENTEEPDKPFDALYLYVNNELIKFISGVVAYQSESITLPAGIHNITWKYIKDDSDSNGPDNGHIRNVVFSPVEPIIPPIQQSNKSGGSLTWLLLIYMSIIGLRKNNK